MFSQLSWLSVDFNNWKDWEDDSEEEMGNFDQLSDVRASSFIIVKKCFWDDNISHVLFFTPGLYLSHEAMPLQKCEWLVAMMILEQHLSWFSRKNTNMMISDHDD